MEDAVAVKTFSSKLSSQNIHFYILKLKESYLLWIGTDTSFRTLAIAMNSRLDTEPLCTQLLGDSTDNAAGNLAQRLVKRYGHRCFVSMNVQDTTLHPIIEDYVIKMLDKEPQNFLF